MADIPQNQHVQFMMNRVYITQLVNLMGESPQRLTKSSAGAILYQLYLCPSQFEYNGTKYQSSKNLKTQKYYSALQMFIENYLLTNKSYSNYYAELNDILSVNKKITEIPKDDRQSWNDIYSIERTNSSSTENLYIYLYLNNNVHEFNITIPSGSVNFDAVYVGKKMPQYYLSTSPLARVNTLVDNIYQIYDDKIKNCNTSEELYSDTEFNFLTRFGSKKKVCTKIPYYFATIPCGFFITPFKDNANFSFVLDTKTTTNIDETYYTELDILENCPQPFYNLCIGKYYKNGPYYLYCSQNNASGQYCYSGTKIYSSSVSTSTIGNRITICTFPNQYGTINYSTQYRTQHGNSLLLDNKSTEALELLLNNLYDESKYGTQYKTGSNIFLKFWKQTFVNSSYKGGMTTKGLFEIGNNGNVSFEEGYVDLDKGQIVTPDSGSGDHSGVVSGEDKFSNSEIDVNVSIGYSNTSHTKISFPKVDYNTQVNTGAWTFQHCINFNDNTEDEYKLWEKFNVKHNPKLVIYETLDNESVKIGECDLIGWVPGSEEGTASNNPPTSITLFVVGYSLGAELTSEIRTIDDYKTKLDSTTDLTFKYIIFASYKKYGSNQTFGKLFSITKDVKNSIWNKKGKLYCGLEYTIKDNWDNTKQASTRYMTLFGEQYGDVYVNKQTALVSVLRNSIDKNETNYNQYIPINDIDRDTEQTKYITLNNNIVAEYKDSSESTFYIKETLEKNQYLSIDASIFNTDISTGTIKLTHSVSNNTSQYTIFDNTDKANLVNKKYETLFQGCDKITLDITIQNYKVTYQDNNGNEQTLFENKNSFIIDYQNGLIYDDDNKIIKTNWSGVLTVKKSDTNVKWQVDPGDYGEGSNSWYLKLYYPKVYGTHNYWYHGSDSILHCTITYMLGTSTKEYYTYLNGGASSLSNLKKDKGITIRHLRRICTTDNPKAENYKYALIPVPKGSNIKYKSAYLWIDNYGNRDKTVYDNGNVSFNTYFSDDYEETIDLSNKTQKSNLLEIKDLENKVSLYYPPKFFYESDKQPSDFDTNNDEIQPSKQAKDAQQEYDNLDPNYNFVQNSVPFCRYYLQHPYIPNANGSPTEMYSNQGRCWLSVDPYNKTNKIYNQFIENNNNPIGLVNNSDWEVQWSYITDKEHNIDTYVSRYYYVSDDRYNDLPVIGTNEIDDLLRYQIRFSSATPLDTKNIWVSGLINRDSSNDRFFETTYFNNYTLYAEIANDGDKSTYTTRFYTNDKYTSTIPTFDETSRNQIGIGLTEKSNYNIKIVNGSPEYGEIDIYDKNGTDQNKKIEKVSSDANNPSILELYNIVMYPKDYKLWCNFRNDNDNDSKYHCLYYKENNKITYLEDYFTFSNNSFNDMFTSTNIKTSDKSLSTTLYNYKKESITCKYSGIDTNTIYKKNTIYIGTGTMPKYTIREEYKDDSILYDIFKTSYTFNLGADCFGLTYANNISETPQNVEFDTTNFYPLSNGVTIKPVVTKPQDNLETSISNYLTNPFFTLQQTHITFKNKSK